MYDFDQIHKKETNTKWVKFGGILPLHFIGKETVVCGTGCFIRFYDLVSKKETIYKANGQIRGDGVQCIAGHRSLSMFAFAEKSYKPRILVLTYPDFNQITVIEGGTLYGYLAIAFSEMEYLVSLSSLPYFAITVWCWKTGDKLASEETFMKTTNQIIRCSLGSPLVVSQLSLETTELLVWEVHFCSKVCILRKNEVKLPAEVVAPCSSVWSPEGMLYICDAGGNIYSVEADKTVLAIPWTQQEDIDTSSGTKVPCMVWFKGGIVVSGPNSVVKFYKKGPKGWTETWSVRHHHHIAQLTTFIPKDYLIGMTDQAELVLWNMDNNEPLFNDEQTYHAHFTDMCLIHPAGNQIVTLDTNQDLKVWDLETGAQIGEKIHQEDIKMMASNPAMPCLGFGKANGIVEFLSMYDSTKPNLLAAARLSNEDIDTIKFTPSGYVAVVATATKGEFFAIKMQPGERIMVVGYVNVGAPLAKIVLVEDSKAVNVYALVITVDCCKSGNILSHSILNKTMWSFSSQKSKVFDLNGDYSDVCKGRGSSLFAVPHRSRILEQLMLTDTSVISENTSQSGHQLRKYRLHEHEAFLVTYGMDGIVMVRSREDLDNCIAMLMPHHRIDLGVLKAAINSAGSHIVSLGKDMTLTCTDLLLTKPDEEDVLKPEPEPEWREMLIKSIKGPLMSVQESGKTWLSTMEQNIVMQETIQYSLEKRNIIRDFKAIQKKTVDLLEQNFINPPEEVLPISEFDLDKEYRAQRIEEARVKRLATEQQMKAHSAAQDQLTKKIKDRCWDVIETKGRCIKGIDNKFEVESYPLFSRDLKANQKVNQILERRKLEAMVNKSDTFYPWLPATASTLKAQIASGPVLEDDIADDQPTPQESTEEFDANTIGSETPANIPEPEENTLAWSGTSTHKFIEVSPYHCTQFNCTTYNQVCDEILVIKADTTALRFYFNKQFDEVYALKEREMQLVSERNTRLRYILSELHDTSKTIDDPTWHPTEKPHTIMMVEDKEVGVKPYISPSEQAILDKIAAEKEARRLAELADNFREKALIEMMDGVLEVRWEDIIKKDIPLPKCMIDKEPENFNEEDLRTVKDYEEKVAFLMSERARYKRMLEAEFEVLSKTVKAGIKKFDKRLAELNLLKLKVESAIDQENLKLLRMRLYCQQRLDFQSKEEAIKTEIANNETAGKLLKTEILELQKISAEVSASYETLQTKDKNLDKNFRKEFPELSQIITDQLYKAYRKRTKAGQRAFVSAIIVNEIAKCCITGVKPPFLPGECIDFLKSLDSQDHSLNAPSNVNEDLWLILCRVRRIKIESELKIKATALELAEAESTVSVFQKKLSAAKDHGNLLQKQLNQLRKEKLEFELNKEVTITNTSHKSETGGQVLKLTPSGRKRSRTS